MIIAESQHLALLVDQAQEAFDHSHQDAALEAVRERLLKIQKRLASYGVIHSEWVAMLSPEARELLRSRAQALAAVVGPLQDKSDVEYAVAADPRTGLVMTAETAANNLVVALRTAQDDLLSQWIEELWPSSETATLSVLGHLPSTSRTAERVGAVRDRLREYSADERQLSTELLRRERDEVLIVVAEAAAIGTTPMPQAVVDFWSQAGGIEGIGLEQMTAEVHRWLLDHDALASFRVTAG